MLFGKEGFQKKNSGKYIIGYELGQKHVQMSYLKIGEKEPETFSLEQDQKVYNIPFVLCKNEETNLWYIGQEAIINYQKNGGILLSGLLDSAYWGKLVEVNLESYDSCALLALFVKRSFAYLTMAVPLEKIAAIMFVVENLDQKMVKSLRKMVGFLQLPHVLIHFMGKEESFFYYNFHTEQALWNNQVYLYEMQDGKLTSYELYLNRNTKPMVALIEKKEYKEFPLMLTKRQNSYDESRQLKIGERLPETEEEKEIWDHLFLKNLTDDMAEKIVSTVYLIGNGFLGEWYQKSVRFLCTKRRVFLGNNLFSKGACYALLEKAAPGELASSYVYLGNDKLKVNVGMEVLRQGVKSYLAVLDGGCSWYDCKKEWDMILEDEEQLNFKIIPLNGKNIRQVQIVLHGLVKNKSRLYRIHVEACMDSRNEMKVKVWDKGFGEFYFSTGQCWEETISL